MATTTGAIVLAGGRSERMGQDKALLRLEERTLLQTVVAALRPFADRIVVVAQEPEPYLLPDVEGVADLYPGQGPVGGILTGLTALGVGAHLVVACDMPALQPGILRLLRDSATPEWDAVVPERDGRPEPLCAVYRDTAAPALQSFLATGRRAAFEALKMLRVYYLHEETLRGVDPDLLTFTNLNTPHDLAAFMERANRNRT